MDGEFPSGSGGMGGAAPAEEDFTKMPVEDRLASKVSVDIACGMY